MREQQGHHKTPGERREAMRNDEAAGTSWSSRGENRGRGE